MKLTELQPGKYLYHVTFTRNVPKIKQKGIVPLQTSNWVKGRGGERYNEEAGIFAFEHPLDAFKWAFKMGWEQSDKDISIVRFKLGDHWEQDPSEDPSLRFGKGRSLRSERAVNPDAVIDSFRVEDFGKPVDLGITQDEWFKRIEQTLSQ